MTPSVVCGAQGEICHTSLANSALGLVMYASYFVLFLELFLSHYVYNKKPLKGCPPPDLQALTKAADLTSKGRPASDSPDGPARVTKPKTRSKSRKQD